MLGFRGASRYIAESFRDCFELECEALKRVRDDNGAHQRRADGAVRAHRRRGAAGDRPPCAARPATRRERPAHRHDVRAAFERAARRPVPRALRRLLDRLERPDPDDPRRSTATRGSSPRRSTSATPRCKYCCGWRSRLAGARASTSESAAKARPTIPISRRWLVAEGIESLSLNPDTVVETWLELAKAA